MLEQEALKEEEVEQDNVEDYHHLGDGKSILSRAQNKKSSMCTLWSVL